MFTINQSNLSLITGDDGVLVCDMTEVELGERDYAVLSIRADDANGVRGEMLDQWIQSADVENNRFVFIFAHEDTLEYPPNTYNWQIEFVFEEIEHRIMNAGKFEVTKAVRDE